MSITQEDIDALHQSPRSANDSDVTELCEKIAELQVSLAVSQREAADWKQELEAYKATENARISELQAENQRLENSADELLTERDHAEEAVGDLFFAVMGYLAEWSNVFGYGDAREVVEEHDNELRKKVADLEAKVLALQSWQESTIEDLAIGKGKRVQYYDYAKYMRHKDDCKGGGDHCCPCGMSQVWMNIDQLLDSCEALAQSQPPPLGGSDNG